jgi:hypothetical protein
MCSCVFWLGMEVALDAVINEGDETRRDYDAKGLMLVYLIDRRYRFRLILSHIW